MTEQEELEAGSWKYYSHRILRLRSGNYALFNVAAELVKIGTWAELEEWYDTVKPEKLELEEDIEMCLDISEDEITYLLGG